MRVAVLGAGLVGSCVALELADSGHDVILFDRHLAPLCGASTANEGKIHLGFVYALKAPIATATVMQCGAAVFRPLLERWLTADILDDHGSRPFVYAVPRTSLLDPSAIRAHFAEVERLWHSNHAGARYLQAIEGPLSSPLGDSDFDALFDRRHVADALRTEEVAIDPVQVCDALRVEVLRAPRLEFRGRTEVERVERTRGGFRVLSQADCGDESVPCSQVVNALWQERLRVDASLGLASDRPVIHRFRVGFRASILGASAPLPTVSFVLGPYGDTVTYRDGVYASWYPSGLLSQEVSPWPSRTTVSVECSERPRLLNESLEGLATFMPGARRALTPDRDWRMVGGFISAWGRQGIEQKESELHQRHEVGVHSTHGYHSIDTGKFTLAPLFAAETCCRIAQG